MKGLSLKSCTAVDMLAVMMLLHADILHLSIKLSGCWSTQAFASCCTQSHVRGHALNASMVVMANFAVTVTITVAVPDTVSVAAFYSDNSSDLNHW